MRSRVITMTGNEMRRKNNPATFRFPVLEKDRSRYSDKKRKCGKYQFASVSWACEQSLTYRNDPIKSNQIRGSGMRPAKTARPRITNGLTEQFKVTMNEPEPEPEIS